MAHARMSPSGAHRWMACPGSVVLEAEVPDTGNAYSREGTVAHELAAGHLLVGWPLDEYVGELWHGEENGEKWTVLITKEMVDHVKAYVAFVRERADGKELLVEQRVPIEHLTGEVGARGTGDAVIIDAANRHIEVIDLKYGAGVLVSARGNPQLRMYALGALYEHEIVYDFDTVTTTIYQPRIENGISSETLGIDDLRAFAAEVQKAAAAASAADGGPDSLRPGEKQCKFCSAKATCPALRAELFEVIGAAPATAADFADFTIAPVDATDGENWLAAAMGRIDLIEGWCKSVRAETERRLMAGIAVPGYKLVEGKLGNRAWKDAAAAEEALKSMRLKQDEMYERKLINPTAAEKLLKKASPKRWASLADHITRSPGKPSVAPVTDPRPTWSSTATAADFADL